MLRAVVIMLTTAALLLACGEDEPSASNSNGDRNTATSQAVEIVEFRFEPDDLRVTPGTTVTWTNGDDFAHTVTADESDGFDSGDIAAGATFEHTFERSGTFTYFCDIHNYMKATVVVG